jgi:hypothetical protein
MKPNILRMGIPPHQKVIVIDVNIVQIYYTSSGEKL